MLTGGVILSSLEYPGKMSLVIFTGGCPLRCPYCHNPEIIAGGDDTPLSTIKKEIDESLDFIDAVVITGGEPTMQMEGLGQILEYSREKGLKTKLDTNGCYPESLQEILELVDYVALDIKAPFAKYKEIIGVEIGEKVKKSMEIITNSNVFLECRTTYVPGLLEPEDVYEIARNIQCDIYTLQQFRNRVVLDEKLKNTPDTDPKELKEIALQIKPQLGKVKIKTSQFGEEII
ncbi:MULTISPECIES: anaerobic ribonucleoside-triphosphate reductase activating protein [Methanobacterium]|jgi:pyruvate formate lyase activating enzyme|uniref:Anaerobic ribonucleoside-triphosphate reductase activating protein n=1 Tax=Methanobacterium formicicum TaxID=2162 RepID=A0A090I0R9_METFO|nr:MULTISPECIES: anaerobic ribonucleoside-triphosphate reductase activating protein [Methanobacterium]KUK75761.1 MAG: Anaerobic ribonucleoside-triphosphate reductase activating protein [Methanobacterium sp. 42_16]MBF4476126.1 anaerobic ribonucleoside-triphosphate reductase activating protein [Methanobacterium formicicum]MDD4809959.1 anaerobic ribonucleoside-triphosphate reductase activating protein [Methanobacterium formicicum]MDG3546527.1 anaerobic ribonucleoside-triphosphate reductase activat